ncbi:MAG: hypothetical protein RBR80_00500 [Bacilli bacterium]|nr:hypothetical protein [Bacilli bacterium]
MSKMDATGKKPVIDKEKYEANIKLVILFVSLELLAFVAMNLGNYMIIFNIISILLVLASLPILIKILKVEQNFELLIYAIPLLFYFLLILLGPTYKVAPENLGQHPDYIFMGRSIFKLLESIGGLISFFLLAYIIRRTDGFKHKYVPYMILGGFALLVSVSLIATLYNYGAFYRLIYQNMVNYYAGKPYLVAKQSSYLLGFNIATVDSKALVNIALFLASSLVTLLFIKEKNNRKQILILSGLGLIGILTIALLPDFTALVFLIPSFAFALLYKYDQLKTKWFKITALSILGLVGLSIIVGLFCAFGNQTVINLLSSNGFTRKIFLNSKVLVYYQVIRDSFVKGAFFGVPFTYSVNEFPLSTGITVKDAFPTGNFLMDALREVGWIGFLSLLIFVVFSVKVVINYLDKSEDPKHIKTLFVSLLIMIFVRYFFFYPHALYSFTSEFWSINYFPLIESHVFTIVIFLLGYLYLPNSIFKQNKLPLKEENKHNDKKEEVYEWQEIK